ncbi:MAG: tetratricopeptide repeat protein [Desulfobacteraceae bacterium]|nr:tetratricopeptide repeat protein [Desulfobacteraceae bacterium]
MKRICINQQMRGKIVSLAFLMIVTSLSIYLVCGCSSTTELKQTWGHIETYVERGKFYMSKGQYDQAISEFNKAIQINPKYVNAYLYRGHAYAEKGQYDQAISEFNSLLRLKPRLAAAYHGLGYAYGKKGQHDQAISEFNKAIEINPKFFQAYLNRAVSYRLKGEYDQAISDCNKALEINPQYLNAYYERGVVYTKKLQYDQAISEFNKAIDINPRYHKAYVGKGGALENLGRIKEAIESYRNFLQYSPPKDASHPTVLFAKDKIKETDRKALQKTEAVATRPSLNSIQGKRFYASYAVVIGISKHKHPAQDGLTDLIFADDDAERFAATLRELGWQDSHIRLLLNEQATQRNIMIALESWLTKTGPNDLVILFWSGHAFPDPEDPEKVYLACYDTEISIPPTGYRMDKVHAALKERRARNVIVFADTCHAGKLITRGKKGIAIVPHINKMHKQQSIPKGWIFMVGADTDRLAVENSSWSNGAFTHCLVQGLSGKADGFQSVASKDGIVTMGELRAYLNTSMPDETQKVLGVGKRPVITTSTGNPDIWNLTLQRQ